MCVIVFLCVCVPQNLLHQTWFAMYSRGRGVDDSSGFEHVFVGESKRGEITVSEAGGRRGFVACRMSARTVDVPGRLDSSFPVS